MTRYPANAVTFRCSDCNELKPQNYFAASASQQSGAGVCVDCQMAIAAAWRARPSYQLRRAITSAKISDWHTVVLLPLVALAPLAAIRAAFLHVADENPPAGEFWRAWRHYWWTGTCRAVARGLLWKNAGWYWEGREPTWSWDARTEGWISLRGGARPPYVWGRTGGNSSRQLP